MKAAFFRNTEGQYHASVDPPHSVLGSFLEDEVGTSNLKLPFNFKSYSEWLERAAAEGKPSPFSGDAHGLLYDGGIIAVEHDYDLHPSTRISADQFRKLLETWHKFVTSGEETRDVVL
jgi:uncharacterized protein YacL (UPF0231 family)